MTSNVMISADSDAALLRTLAGSRMGGASLPTADELGQCVRPFLPVLFALADRAGVADREAAVFAMLDEVQHWCHCWESTGLPARAWVVGMAQKRLRQYQLSNQH
ncbi:hypothetical protein E7T06_02105 [Deinococcus sp. Arct2-2]|uniref:hypothetical protein n=1 Tax=Deinococcus sp. Arct2-2 TaxID=2568653 RepID=UPI0010A4FEA3|nr:hypothetical protein [Deinococcus sp. Arct2-2]THF71771.1 hypothetical protein E7T06_02105 [Deinococcus sp. Arct2-2]